METGEGKPKPPSPTWLLTWPSPLPPTGKRKVLTELYSRLNFTLVRAVARALLARCASWTSFEHSYVLYMYYNNLKMCIFIQYRYVIIFEEPIFYWIEQKYKNQTIMKYQIEKVLHSREFDLAVSNCKVNELIIQKDVVAFGMMSGNPEGYLK